VLGRVALVLSTEARLGMEILNSFAVELVAMALLATSSGTQCRNRSLRSQRLIVAISAPSWDVICLLGMVRLVNIAHGSIG